VLASTHLLGASLSSSLTGALRKGDERLKTLEETPFNTRRFWGPTWGQVVLKRGGVNKNNSEPRCDNHNDAIGTTRGNAKRDATSIGGTKAPE